MAKLKMAFSALSFLGIISMFSVPDAHAYSLIGKQYSTAPLNQKYFNDCGTYVYNGALTNFYNAVQTGISSWNNTQNTKVYMIQTANQADSVMDFHTLDVGDPNVLGRTNFWNGQTKVDPKTTTWYWAKISINSNGNWTDKPAGTVYTSLDGKAIYVAAHEEGHGLGLDHVSNYVLMFGTTATYQYYGINTPQNDEILGIQGLYGTLR